MTLTIKLTKAEKQGLERLASERGMGLDEYARTLLLAGSGASAPVITSGAELVDYWQREGVLGAKTGDTDSAAAARHIRKRAEQRVRSN
jgi:hypothetical protein